MSVEDVATRYDRLKTLHVGILAFPEVEVLDFAGPFEVFSVASRVALRDPACQAPPFKVSLIGATGSTVTTRHGLVIHPHSSFADQVPVDILVVPGGVVDQPLAHRETLDWVRQSAEGAALTASVCTGAFVLAKAGLLEGLRVTTHWEDIPDLRAQFPQLDVAEHVSYVDQGNVVTSAGISAGIDMSLHLVERVLGPALARATARQMQYHWNEQ